MIFDFDGTLLDTFPAIAAAWNAAMTPIFGKHYSDAEVVARFGPPDEGMIAQELADHPPAIYDEAVERYFAKFEEADRDIAAFDGIVALLDELAARGVPLGIMTGKGRRAADLTFERLGWNTRFQVLVTGDDVPDAKPAPDGVLLAAREMGFAPQECVYVGDSPADMGAARAAQMTAVVAGWHGFFRAALEQMEPDFWADSPAQLGAWLQREFGSGPRLRAYCGRVLRDPVETPTCRV